MARGFSSDPGDKDVKSVSANMGLAENAGLRFVHLHTHSAYSLLEGALRLDPLVEMAIGDGQPALAVTDRNNLFGALEFSQKASKNGLQPIVGAKLAFVLDDEAEQMLQSRRGNMQGELPHLVLLAMDKTGYNNLVKLVSRAHLGGGDGGKVGSDKISGDKISGDKANPIDKNETGQAGPQTGPQLGPHIALGDLHQFGDGLICLSGGDDGPINPVLAAGDKIPAGQKRQNLAGQRLQELARIFGDRLYVEIQRHGSRDEPREEANENALLGLAFDLELPIVATNQPYFARREDFAAHDALMCIAKGTVIAADDRRQLTPEHYFKTQDEMAALFADLPEALANTIEIARRCHFFAPGRDPILPRFTIGKGEANAAKTDNNKPVSEIALLRSQVETGLEQRLDAEGMAEGYSQNDYHERMEFELGVIEQMGFPGYFLIVADFIKWAKSKGIAVGPGRGSGAGSLVAWALTITDPDPLRFSLLFERFLNPERISMPDFDIDFCQERREEVIRYVQGKYGFDQVAQIITFGTLQARAVLRDVGRVLQMPYGQVDRLAKLIPANPANPVTLSQAIESEPRLQEARADEPIVARLFDIATRLEGLYRHASTHAAGLVIGDRPLDELVPLYRDPRSDIPVTQFNMKWVEAAGLVKFDFLGLKTLTVIEETIALLRTRGVEIVPAQIPLDDAATFDMLSRAQTIGVFQLESAGMRKALLGMRPDRIEDVIALVALYRPGPMENIPVYNARKNGEEAPDYYHPMIEAVLKETYGVIIYQEQVLQIAQILAGYTLGEADILRKAMGKKIRSEMNKQRDIFIERAVKRGLKKFKASEIFDLLAKFADYGFNKAHATAYAIVSYHTAYLKTHFPVEFVAASMQYDISNTDKLAVFRQDAEALGIEIVAPSIALSTAKFSVRDGKIYYGLSAIKGVGAGAVQSIIDERDKNGAFSSLEDLFSRLDLKQVNRRTLESLICAGALDGFEVPRERLLAGLDRLLGHAQRISHDRETGQNDMFGGPGEAAKIVLPQTEAWGASEKLQKEFIAMGFYLSAHPLDEYRPVLEKQRVQLFAEFENSVRGGANAGRLAGTVISRQERKTRTGKKMGIVTLSDPTGQYEAILFEELLVESRDLLEPGGSVILLVGAEMREEGLSIRIQSVLSLESVANGDNPNLRVFIEDEKAIKSIGEVFYGKMSPHKGQGSVSIIVMQNNKEKQEGSQMGDSSEMEVEIMLADRFKIDKKIVSAVKSLPGIYLAEFA